jgi:glycosyltransferase involved in cell wall biosynthesis
VSDPADPPGGRRAIHQFVPALIPRDATGSHTLLLRQVLRRAGWRSEIFAEATHDELLGQSLPIGDYPAHAADGDVLVYQFSTSSMVADFLAARPEPLVLDYHNVTDPALSEGWDPDGAARSAAALEQLARLAPRSVLGLADSAFNRRDLVAAGCPATAVVPVLVDLERLVAAPDPRVAARLAAARDQGGSDWLFVGRLVPSKGQHQLVKALWAHRRLYGAGARLHLVGPAPSRRYLVALRDFVTELGLDEVVHLTGEVSDQALAAYFAAADAYVSLSVHEGFGVPLLEAMRAGVPVVARAEGAVAETVDGAGLLLDRDRPSLVAGVVERVLTDPDLRARLVAGGRRRTAALSPAVVARRAVAALATVAGPPPGPPAGTVAAA